MNRKDFERRRYEGYHQGASGRSHRSDWDDQEFIGKGQQHFGKGPKNYKRSDSRIYEDVCEALCRHPAIDASGIEVSVKESIVTLTGTVESRRLKHLAEDIVDDVLGVEDVVNMLWMVGEKNLTQQTQ